MECDEVLASYLITLCVADFYGGVAHMDLSKVGIIFYWGPFIILVLALCIAIATAMNITRHANVTLGDKVGITVLCIIVHLVLLFVGTFGFTVMYKIVS